MDDFKIDVFGRDIDKGDDKKVLFEPLGSEGEKAIVGKIDFTITKPSGNAITKTKSDFSESDGVWETTISFDEAGHWKLKLKVTSGANKEVATDIVNVRE